MAASWDHKHDLRLEGKIMPKQPQSTIDHSGRVAIPKAIRIRLGLLPGTKLVIEERDDKVVLLRPLPESVPGR